jgi:hypothetical protein
MISQFSLICDDSPADLQILNRTKISRSGNKTNSPNKAQICSKIIFLLFLTVGLKDIDSVSNQDLESAIVGAQYD